MILITPFLILTIQKNITILLPLPKNKSRKPTKIAALRLLPCG